MSGDGVEIREYLAGDAPALEPLYSAAFPEEDLLPLVRALHSERSGVLSLVAVADNVPAGHIVFTTCGISGNPARAALLGPLAVSSIERNRGIGGRLVKEGLSRLAAEGIRKVFVLGDPAYYGRFGFAPESDVVPPYPLPVAWRDAWQSFDLDAAETPLAGILTVPGPWNREALWSP
ncbi:GNAT family N-acetyltransferase [Nisaea sp.]|uniref:GNAT family N-acetyltransferase n=1 Tax=Nisaea sp. TaxID=2024842 RepID=UPI003B519144